MPFQRLRQKKYAAFTPNHDQFPLPTTEAQRHDVARLNELRNDFIHFIPKSYVILDVSAFPRIVLSCTELMLYLIEQGDVLWHIRPTDEDADVELPTTLHLRALRDEARAIAAAYGIPIE